MSSGRCPEMIKAKKYQSIFCWRPQKIDWSLPSTEANWWTILHSQQQQHLCTFTWIDPAAALNTQHCTDWQLHNSTARLPRLSNSIVIFCRFAIQIRVGGFSVLFTNDFLGKGEQIWFSEKVNWWGITSSIWAWYTFKSINLIRLNVDDFFFAPLTTTTMRRGMFKVYLSSLLIVVLWGAGQHGFVLCFPFFTQTKLDRPGASVNISLSEL